MVLYSHTKINTKLKPPSIYCFSFSLYTYNGMKTTGKACLIQTYSISLYLSLSPLPSPHSLSLSLSVCLPVSVSLYLSISLFQHQHTNHSSNCIQVLIRNLVFISFLKRSWKAPNTRYCHRKCFIGMDCKSLRIMCLIGNKIVFHFM